MKNNKHRRWLAKQTKPKAHGVRTYHECAVGVVRLHNHIPQFPAAKRWSLSVPKQARRAT